MPSLRTSPKTATQESSICRRRRMNEAARLPLRFWILVEAGVITLNEAVAEWHKQEAAGVPFDL